ncbi:hypothetical protein GCM10010149_45350 [Nonomuraea roseoviolacea subsp. roseoviolacea]
MDRGEIRAWFQVQRQEWRHGCDDPHTCGEKWHRRPCHKKCKVHGHRPTCVQSGHVCYKRPCLKDCTGHADKCPQRTGGGLAFRQRKGKSKLTLQCPPELLAQLKAHSEIQDAEREKAGERWQHHDLVFATKHDTPIERTEDWKGVEGHPEAGGRPRRPPYSRDTPYRAGCEHPRRTAGPRPHEGHDHRALHPRIHTADARRGGAARLGSLGELPIM